MKQIRESVIAGMWYPGQKNVLKNVLEGLLDRAPDNRIENIRALISPHAGYAYSGGVAAAGYKQLKGKDYKKIIILAPSHQHPFNGISAGDYTHYRTPLGDVPVSTETRSLIKESSIFSNTPQAHFKEHSLEIQLPFLQVVLDDFSIIPLVFGLIGLDEARKVADLITGCMDDKTLLVVSTDLSHYHGYDEAIKLDKDCITSILLLDSENTFKRELCGKYPVLAALESAKKMNWTPKLLEYKNSGDVTGDKTQGVVGYASIAFTGEIK